VIYIATEGSRGVARQRIPGWVDAHHIPQALRRNIMVIPDEVMLDRQEWVDALIEVGRSLRELPTLVLVDIFGASMSGPETVHETATAWVRMTLPPIFIQRERDSGLEFCLIGRVG